MNRPFHDPRALAAAASMLASLGCASLPASPVPVPFEVLGAFDPQGCAENALRRSADAALLPESAQVLERGCAVGEADACSIAGVMYELGRGVRMNRRRAQSLYERACGAGNERGCGNLGELLRAGGDRRGPVLLARACDAGQGRACLVLGRAEIEEANARGLLERACAAGEAAGCLALADVLERSEVPGDPERALVALGRACTRGEEAGCTRYAQRTRVWRGRW